jgi:hypothetical protein
MKRNLQRKNVTEADIDQSFYKCFYLADLRGCISVSGNCNYGVNTPANTSVSQLKGLHNTSLLEIIFSDYLELLSPPHIMSSLLPCRADLS